MPQPPTLFPKLHVSTTPPEPHSATSVMASFPTFGSSQHIPETGTQHQIFRAKRKHVLKACDRCRVKKTKCDGNQPCYRCAAYNHPCLFRERKATQTKAYSKGFVEMLESHHALVVKALQQLYTHCINNECFPGDPIDIVDGNPCTHAILDRLGLIKQAEEVPEKLEQNSVSPPPCWKQRPMSSDSMETDELSPEPASSVELSPSSKDTSVSPCEIDCVKIEPSFTCPQVPYAYHGGASMWPMQVSSVELSQSYPTTGFSLGTERVPGSSNVTSTYLNLHQASSFMSTGERPINVSRPCLQPGSHVLYPSTDVLGLYHGPDDGTGGVDAHYSWVPGNWHR